MAQGRSEKDAWKLAQFLTNKKFGNKTSPVGDEPATEIDSDPRLQNPYYRAKEGLKEDLAMPLLEKLKKIMKKRKLEKEQTDTPMKFDAGSSYANRTDSGGVGNGRDTGHNI